jgi:hypothetical protein
MNREDVIRMARVAHGPITDKWWDMDVASLDRFAALVASHEREACAKVCEQLGATTNGTYERNAECAAAIRARISHA